jgi:hypothetical protein
MYIRPPFKSPLLAPHFRGLFGPDSPWDPYPPLHRPYFRGISGGSNKRAKTLSAPSETGGGAPTKEFTKLPPYQMRAPPYGKTRFPLFSK